MRPDAARIAYRGTLVSVTVERWGDHEREIVEHPGSVAVVALDGQERVTFVRQRREPARRRLVELPAGTLEPDEQPLEAARRELAEETGLTRGRWAALGGFWTTPGFCREYMHVFVAEGVAEGEASPATDEELEVLRWPLADVSGWIGELDDAKTIAGLALYLRQA